MYNVASALKVLIRYFFIIPALQLEHYNKKSKFEYHFCLVEIAGADLFYSFTFLCYLIFFRFHAHIVALSKEQIFDFFTYIFFYLQRSLSRSSFFFIITELIVIGDNLDGQYFVVPFIGHLRNK
jgi:hypothetical protein